MLIKVDKFVLPIDFVILDMPEDSRTPIILGRPFFATARAMIDVFNKKITLRVGDDKVIFDMDQLMKKPTTDDDECYNVDDLDDTINEETHRLLVNDQLDSFLLSDQKKSINQADLENCSSIMDNFIDDSGIAITIHHIDLVDTVYSEEQKTIVADTIKKNIFIHLVLIRLMKRNPS
ncbi:DNA-directed DNA polymerase [Tanacetum coccineum]